VPLRRASRGGIAEANNSFCLACYYRPEVRRYNWKRVGVRVALASGIAVLIALSAHSSRNAWPPRICNGGFMDGVVFILGLFAAMLVVEGFHWGAWLMRQQSDASRATSQLSLDNSSPTGGRLFAPVGWLSSFLLALLVLFVVRAYIGTLTACEGVDPSSISKRMVVGAIFQAYGVLLLAEVALRKYPLRQIGKRS